MWWTWILLGCGPSRDTDVPVDTDPLVETDLPVVETDTDTDPIDTALALWDPWVRIEGGTFTMGTPVPASDFREEPAIEVTVPTFAIMRYEVTIEEYERCVTAGGCVPRPAECDGMEVPDRPASCLDWEMAHTYCAWYGGRLPSEAEWEFAASSRGQPYKYPWGDEPVTCDRANSGTTQLDASCDDAGTWRVCTHPLGNTPLGLCEMAGNVFEWLQDYHQDYYYEHPTDGSAVTTFSDFRSMRGGSIGSTQDLRVKQRTYHPPEFWFGGMGVRCAMDL